MRLSILGFAVGICLLQWQAALPDLATLAACGSVGVVLLLLTTLSGPRWRMLAPLCTLLLGFAWAAGFAQVRLADALAVADEGRDIQVTGIVAKLPQTIENGVRFDFLVEQVAHPDASVPEHLSLAWYSGWRPAVGNLDAAGKIDETPNLELHAAPLVRVGERWRFTVRLKRPHGNVNPHGYDHEAWLLENGVRATGYVRPAPDNLRLAEFVATPRTVVERAREGVRERFERRLVGRPYAGILTALAIGDQRAIDPAQWRQFSRTGITHLMSISGLHVTMLASLAYAMVSALWRRSPALMLRLPAQRAAVVGGLVTALGYCLIAGFAVPAQRTLYMLAVAAVALWTQRVVSASRVLSLALLAVLLLDPWAVLTAGFWLSFGAVGVLFYVGSGRLGAGHRLLAWGRLQWAVTLGSLPALLLLFQQFSLVSPVANAVAIPLVSFVVTPLALAASLPGFGFLLEPAYWVTEWLMCGIAWLAELPWAVWQQHAPSPWAWLSGLAGCLWLLLPRGFPARWLGLAGVLPLLLAAPLRPAPGSARLTVLDVGQGLAIHIQTARRDLLFDAGPLYTSEANSGNRVIVPYLRASGVGRLDGMVISHRDVDHSGGAEAVLDAVPVGWLMSSLEFEHPLSAVPVSALPCYAGQRWEWDGVRFEVLHPLAEQYAEPTRKTNDMSCVIRVGTRHGSVLLASDIEALSEQALLARHGGAAGAVEAAGALHADVLIAPHHGSRTSSTPEFIAAVGAATVIFPVGYRNPFGHPRADVVERYRVTGAALRRTDREGALVIELQPARLEGDAVTVRGARAAQWRYWYGR